MFPNDPNNTNTDNLNQNNNSEQISYNQVPQQPAQPAPDQFQQYQQPMQSSSQLPPVQVQQPQQPQPTQPSSFNPIQQMGYQETPAKKKTPNALLLTIVFVVLLIIGVAVAMVLISGKSKTSVTTSPSSLNSAVITNQSSDNSSDTAISNTPQILDTTAVVQDFYDNYLVALKAKSQSSQRVEVLHTYVKNNQDLTPSYQAQLLKTSSTSQDPLLFGQKNIPSTIKYGDPVVKKGDDKTVMLPVTAQFGSTNQLISVTLSWQASQTRAGYWQITKVTK